MVGGIEMSIRKEDLASINKIDRLCDGSYGKRVYISGGITGISDYKDKFNDAEMKLKSLCYSVINPAKVNDILPTDMSYDEYMEIDYKMLDMCEIIYLIPGWNKSKGSKLELKKAMDMNMRIMTVEDLEKELKEIEPKPFAILTKDSNIEFVIEDAKVDLSQIFKVDY